jgi:glycosyltransferase involved in cell wall biosynthesis
MDSQTYVPREAIWYENAGGQPSVGRLRNECIRLADDAPYIAHWDHDDISAPDRLRIQMEHIQKTGKLVTGFWDCPQYDLKRDKVWIYENPHKNLYALGNGLLYRREAWGRVKFPEDRLVDDPLWKKNVGGENIETRSVWENGKPLMIQVVHGANTSATIIRSSTHYKEPSAAQEKAVRELLASA